MHNGKHKTSEVSMAATVAAPVTSSELPIPKLLTFEELAAVVPFSKSTLRRLIKAGSIAKYQPGGRGSRLAFHPDLLKAATAMVSAPDPESAPGASAAPLDPLPAVPTPVRSKLPGPTPKWLQLIPKSTANKKKV